MGTPKRPAPMPPIRRKPYHLAKLVSNDGKVSPLCAVDRPRPINLKREMWTIRDEAVTCAKCKRMIAERAS